MVVSDINDQTKKFTGCSKKRIAQCGSCGQKITLKYPNGILNCSPFIGYDRFHIRYISFSKKEKKNVSTFLLIR